jgi:hypothetical protein
MSAIRTTIVVVFHKRAKGNILPYPLFFPFPHIFLPSFLPIHHKSSHTLDAISSKYPSHCHNNDRPADPDHLPPSTYLLMPLSVSLLLHHLICTFHYTPIRFKPFFIASFHTDHHLYRSPDKFEVKK